MQIQMPQEFPENRPVLAGSPIVSLVLHVRDVAVARAFYVHGVGLRPLVEHGGSVLLDGGGPATLELRGGGGGGGGAEIGLAAHDAAAVRAALERRGVSFEDVPPGAPARFHDPDGNRLALQPAASGDALGAGAGIAGVTLAVPDVPAAAAFLEEVLELTPAQALNGAPCFTGGGLRVALAPGNAAGHDAVPVLHVEDLGDTVWRLAGRGIPLAHTVRYGRTGGFARLEAPWGQPFLLWEPSDEGRDGPGGRKLEAVRPVAAE